MSTKNTEQSSLAMFEKEINNDPNTISVSRISVIIPAYNRARFLPEAIESVLSQTFPVLEIIVVDDGSTDETKEVCDHYPTVKYIYQDNQGVSAARNTGIKLSQGDYLIFLDSDDRLLPQAVEIGLNSIKAHPEAAFVFGHYNFLYINSDGSYTAEENSEKLPEVAASYATILGREHIVLCPGCALIKRTVIESIGGFDPKLKTGEVTPFFLKIAREFSTYCHNQPVLEYRYHGCNVSANAAEMLLSTLYAHNLQWSYIQETGNQQYAAAYERGKQALLKLFIGRIPYQITKYLNGGNWVVAIGLLRLILAYDPKLQFIDQEIYEASYQATLSQLQELPLQSSLAYWQKQLAGATSLLSLPTEKPRPREQTFCGSNQCFELSQQLTTALQIFSQEQKVTLYITLLTALYTLLYRYTDIKNIVIGSPFTDPDPIEIEGLTSYFVNAVALRTDLSGNPSFQGLLKRVRKVTTQAQSHQDLPWEMLVEALQPQRDLNYPPIFQVMFAFEEDISLQKIELSTLTASPWAIEDNTTKFDLTLFVKQTSEGIIGKWVYNTDLFDASTIERMNGHFQTLLNGIVANPQQPISELPLLTAQEKQQLLVEWNNTGTKDRLDKCVHQLFEEQVEQNPDRVAVVFKDQQLTYRELNARANQLAYYLQNLGVSPDVLVGIYIEARIERVIAKLGILKAGGAYVAIDPTYAQEVTSDILADAQVSVLVTINEYIERLSDNKVIKVCLDTDWQKIAQENVCNPDTGVSPHNLVYAIFTTDGANNYKIVAIEHQQVYNYLKGVEQQKPGTDGGNYVLFYTFAADIGNALLFRCLSKGGCFHLLSQEQVSDPDAFLDYGQKHPIDYLKIFPSDLTVFLSCDHPEKILPRQALILAGEATNWDLIEKIKQYAPNCKIFNRYVPKETTLGVVIYRVDSQEAKYQTQKVPLGRPLPNIKIYLLDRHLQPVPIGIPGEVYIGGVGVARGYLNSSNGEENFIPNPFSNEPNARLYKTGDLARYLPDGNLEYQRHIDNQFQIPASSLNLGEIEALLNSQTAISSAELVLPDPTQSIACEWVSPVYTSFTQQAERVPQQLAVVDAQVNWTYEELEERTNFLANYLLTHHIQSQDTVAIYAHRSASLVWAMLGVLKAGAAFVILDPAYPASRLIDYLQISQPRAFLHISAAGELPKSLSEYLETLSCRCRLQLTQESIEVIRHQFSGYGNENPGIEVEPDDLAYIPFTSGSTGKPKGILSTHRPLSHFLQWHSQAFGFNQSDRFSMLSGLSHDPLIRDIFTPLTLGATLCIPQQQDIETPGRLAEWMAQHQITVSHLTPPMGQLLTFKTTISNSSQRYFFFGGDIVTVQDVDRIAKFAPLATCVNFYGATETPQAMGYFIVPKPEERNFSKQVIPVGKGIADVQLLILNSLNQLAGIDELGYIYVRTPYLAKGYIGSEELTSDRFIINPFTNIPEDRLYKTGDLGLYLANGNIEFLGRSDYQVKIRGFRIELAEIEALLSKHPSIQENVVIAREDEPGNKRLVAYIVTYPEQAPSTSEMRQFLQKQLPDYMVPSAFVTLEAIPLTPNGKIDRLALPVADLSDRIAENTIINPRNEIEKQLTLIWEQVLGLKPIGVKDNFFDLGGHSILALRLLSEIEKTFNTKLPVAALFQLTTVEQMANFFQQEDRSAGGSTQELILDSATIQLLNKSSPYYSGLTAEEYRKLLVVVAGRKGKRPTENSLMVAINEQGVKPPLFVCANAYVEVLPLVKHLGKEQPFYLLESGLAITGNVEDKIKAIASHHVNDILAVQPEPPYLLGGYSFGALVAYEIAQQLLANGKPVSLVFFLDRYGYHPNYKKYENFLIFITDHWNHLAPLNFDDKVRYIQENLKRIISKRLPKSIYEEKSQHPYTPQPYPGKVILFCGIPNRREPIPPGRFIPIIPERFTLFFFRRAGWDKRMIPELEIHRVPGDHVSMREEPRVKVLVDKLKACIDKAVIKVHTKHPNDRAPES
jgi:amino acid adenylation domain-containing protein